MLACIEPVVRGEPFAVARRTFDSRPVIATHVNVAL
jgi:hypothetical protein